MSLNKEQIKILTEKDPDHNGLYNHVLWIQHDLNRVIEKYSGAKIPNINFIIASLRGANFLLDKVKKQLTV